MTSLFYSWDLALVNKTAYLAPPSGEPIDVNIRNEAFRRNKVEVKM